MVLCVDCGNTTVSFGLFTNELSKRFKVDTSLIKEANDASVLFDDFFHSIDCNQLEGLIYSSVVPSIEQKMMNVFKKYIPQAKIIFVNCDMKTVINIGVMNPKEIGADLLADLAGCCVAYSYPSLIIDLGTATKIMLLDKNNTFSTCAILPGLELCSLTLSNKTDLLPSIDLNKVTKISEGKNTVECMKNGIIYGHLEAIKGIVNLFEQEIGYHCKKVVTGGASGFFKTLFPNNYIIDDDLIMKGLITLYDMNK